VSQNPRLEETLGVNLDYPTWHNKGSAAEVLEDITLKKRRFKTLVLNPPPMTYCDFALDHEF